MHKDLFNKITELEHLFLAWDEFKHGKRSRKDVMSFECELENNIFRLHEELRSRIYRHGQYEGFFISDPKRRHVHKATVKDRLVHHAVFSVLNPLFEKTFIENSFSCRVGKGSHKGVHVVAKILQKESKNDTRPCYVLKCDIQKFFDNIDHELLVTFLARRIRDEKLMGLLKEIIGSYESGIKREREREREREQALRAPEEYP